MFESGQIVLYVKRNVSEKYRTRYIGTVMVSHKLKSLVRFNVDGKAVSRLLANKNLKAIEQGLNEKAS